MDWKLSYRTIFILLFFCSFEKSFSDHVPAWTITYNDSIVIRCDGADESEFDKNGDFSLPTDIIDSILADTVNQNYKHKFIVINKNFLVDTTTEFYRKCKSNKSLYDTLIKECTHIYNLDKVTFKIPQKDTSGLIKIFFFKDTDDGDSHIIQYNEPTSIIIELHNDSGKVLLMQEYNYKPDNGYVDRDFKIKVETLDELQKKFNSSSFIISYTEYCESCITGNIILGKIILK